MGTSVTADVLVLVVLLGLLGLAVLSAHVSTALRALLLAPARSLPAEDRPPPGLGRLVPVGPQVEQEFRRGVVALELWLVSRRLG